MIKEREDFHNGSSENVCGCSILFSFLRLAYDQAHLAEVDYMGSDSGELDYVGAEAGKGASAGSVEGPGLEPITKEHA